MIDLEQADRRGHTGDEGDDDRQADQRHHARLPLAQLRHGAAQEDDPAVDKDDRAQDRRDPLATGELWRLEAQQLPYVFAPCYDRDGQQQRQPEPVAEHLH
jgi:hypothetical protein